MKSSGARVIGSSEQSTMGGNQARVFYKLARAQLNHFSSSMILKAGFKITFLSYLGAQVTKQSPVMVNAPQCPHSVWRAMGS